MAGVTGMTGVIGVAEGAGSSADRSNRGCVMARGIDARRSRVPGVASASRAVVALLAARESADVVERRVGRRGRRLVGRGEREDGVVVDGVEPSTDLGERLVLALESLDEAEAGEVPVVVLRARARAQRPRRAAPG